MLRVALQNGEKKYSRPVIRVAPSVARVWVYILFEDVVLPRVHRTSPMYYNIYMQTHWRDKLPRGILQANFGSWTINNTIAGHFADHLLKCLRWIPKAAYGSSLQFCWRWCGVFILIAPTRSIPTISRIVATRQPNIFRPMVVSVFCHGISITPRTVPTKSGSIMSLLKSSNRYFLQS